MKHLLFLAVCLLFLSAPLKAQESVIESIDPNAPVMSFEKETIDFGTINQGADGVRTFKFKNTGHAPLIITEVKGECGCTTLPDGWPKEPIKPGASGIIKVKYDTQRTGAFDKKVTITSNAKISSKQVSIKGVVKAGSGTPK
ncbi:MAG: DUF1573 domain-containing protein [Bacteroidia bacterium]